MPRSPKASKAGRPTKLTKEMHERVVDAVRAGNFLEVAAGFNGIDNSTLHRWIERGRKGVAPYAAFVRDLDRARTASEVEDVVELRKAARGGTVRCENCGATVALQNGDPKIRQWLLEKRHQTRWGGKTSLDVKVQRERELEGLLKYYSDHLDAETYRRILQLTADYEGGEAAAGGLARDIVGAS